MATAPRIEFQAVRPLVGLSIAQESMPEAALQTFKKGACVFLSAGYLNECGAAPALILGIASRAGQNTATAGLKSQSVYLAHPDTLFLGNLDNGVTGTGVTAATDRGRNYGIIKHPATGKWAVDNAGAAHRVVVWGFWDGIQDGVPMVVGDTIGWVYFQFDPAFFQGSKTS
jgi:hypothetical protein